MAGRVLDRRKLRQEAEEAAQAENGAGETPVKMVAALKQAKAKKPAAAKVKKTRAKKAPPRLRARWGVFDASMKQVAIFDYNQRTAAEEKVADLLLKKNLHFLQIVKEPIPETTPAEETLQ